MPLEIGCEETDTIDLDAFIDALESDDAPLETLGPLLKRLSNNREFLGDFIIGELENRCASQAENNRYGVQVMMLHAGADVFVRANFWPASIDSLARSSGADVFFYGLPHDHNFSFLTIGHSGPGYWSDYYDYDYEAVAGYPGEEVPLRFVERSCLHPGRVLLYRAHRDIHRQLPPDALSVSLNIVKPSPRSRWCDQYRFDLEGRRISDILTAMPSAMLMRLALVTGGADRTGLVHDFASRHPSDHVRFDAIMAMVERAESADEKRQTLERGIDDGSAQVSGLCRYQLEHM